MEDGTNLPRFYLSRYHKFLLELHENHLHHNYGTQLDRGVTDDTLWQCYWKRLSAQLTR